MNNETILGLNDNHVIYADAFRCHITSDAIKPLEKLAQQAHQAGFELVVASGYRNFTRQLNIWNEKVKGIRKVLDSAGHLLDIHSLSSEDKMWAILRWSALPGASRHHWGTDIDVYDRSRISADYQLQLTLEETIPPGPFAEFHLWLTETLANSNCNFFRPYASDRGGVAPEPWHLSYMPIAQHYYAEFSADLLREQILQTDILLKDTILQNLDEIFERFIKID